MRILFTGGGTGGHLMPIIAIIREIKRLHQGDDIDFVYIGPKNQESVVALEQENVKTYPIVYGKIRRYFSFQNIIDILFKIPFSFLQAFWIVLAIRPKLVFSKGGTGSLPICFWTYIFGIPLFIHESDITPGLSNKTSARWAKKIFTAFPKTDFFNLSKIIVVGNPIKKELLEGNKESAKEVFSIRSEKPVILILGGSQGAEPINNFITIILNDLLKNYEVIHSCGKKNYQKMKMESEIVTAKELGSFYHLYESLDEIQLKHAYAIATFVISRAGAGSIFEIAATGKPSILIPLPTSASNHQSRNAYEFSGTGSSIVVEQENLIPNFFLGKINHLISQPEKLRTMQDAALQFAKPLAAKAIAREILEFLQK